jgi:conjugative relaxase domain, TrwC/TraI family
MSAGSGDYYTNLAREDYYTEGGEPPGQWTGQSADALGLVGTVDKNQLKAVLQGSSPDGEALVQNAGPDHQPGQDLTFSAPKSVSVAWANADEDARHRIQAAQDRAVEAALSRVGELAQTRRGKGGHEKETPAGIIAAKFEHSTSRAQDPQLHTHVVVANLCQRQDGTWGGLETRQIYQNKMALGALYRCELASELQREGFTIERDGDSFKIAGVGPEVVDHFSKRRAVIEEALAEKGTKSAKAAEIAALDSRAVKEVRPREELFAEWQAESKIHGFEFSTLYEQEGKQLDPMPTNGELLKGLTEKSSTFSEADIWKAAAFAGQGHLDAQGVRDHVAQLIEDQELVRLRAANGSLRYSTQERVKLEKQMAEAVEGRMGENAHPVRFEAMDRARESRTLTDEQDRAFTRIVGGQDGVEMLQGHAGTGKSYLLGAAREAWEAEGYNVRGCALAGKAAEGLEKGSDIKSQTLHSFLYELDDGRTNLNSKSVVVMDEAGMVGSEQMADLLGRADAAGAKVVLVGDSKQLQPISGGGAFRALAEKGQKLEITEVFRIKEEWQKDAALAIREGRSAEALAAYEDHGKITVAQNRKEASAQMAQAWANGYEPNKPGDSVMLASTRAEVNELNSLARESLKEQGQLGTVAAEFRSESQGKKIELAEGDRIIFLKNDRQLGVKNGTLAQVEFIAEGKDKTTVHARTQDGQVVKFSDQDYGHVQHGYAVTTHKAQGVTVERSYVLGGGSMASQEMAYVQATRHKQSCNWFFSKSDPEASAMETMQETAQAMNKSRSKDTTLDYKVEPSPSKAPEQKATPNSITPKSLQAPPTRRRDFEMER